MGGGTELSLHLPRPKGLQNILTDSGTYVDGDIAVNSRGLRVGDEVKSDGSFMSLADLEPIKILGKGNSAVVNLVKHKWSNELYALKVIQVNAAPPAREQIKKELKINYAKHNHVVECFQSFYSDGSISLVLEFMDGGSLADVLKQMHTIPEPYLAAITKQALVGLSSLHQAHIIHRDIKPSNLLANKKGEVKISDFGVSTVLASTYDCGQTFVGTYTYMTHTSYVRCVCGINYKIPHSKPERICAGEYSYNSDIWALGMTILECAIGRFPYSPPNGNSTWSNFIELLNAVVQNPAPRSPPNFSPEFQSFISDCLHKDTTMRATAMQLLRHPFVTKYEGQNINVGDLIRQ